MNITRNNRTSFFIANIIWKHVKLWIKLCGLYVAFNVHGQKKIKNHAHIQVCECVIKCFSSRNMCMSDKVLCRETLLAHLYKLCSVEMFCLCVIKICAEIFLKISLTGGHSNFLPVFVTLKYQSYETQFMNCGPVFTSVTCRI